MKKKQFTYAVILGILASCVFTQNISFIKTFGSPGMNGGMDISITSDGGLIATGQHEIPGSHCRTYAYRATGCGTILWYKIYDFGASSGGKRIIPTKDGGYAIAGLRSNGSNYDWILIKLDNAGNLTWSRVIQYSGCEDYGMWVEESSTGDFLITGFFYCSGLGDRDIGVASIGPTGHLTG